VSDTVLSPMQDPFQIQGGISSKVLLSLPISGPCLPLNVDPAFNPTSVRAGIEALHYAVLMSSPFSRDVMFAEK
jgi:hypothetical protein